MESGTARKIARVPLCPLIGLGKGLEKGLLALEEHNLRQKLNYWQYWLQQHHLQPLTGGMGTGTGFALGIRIFDDDFLHRRIRFEMPLRYSTNNYQQFGTMLGFSLLRDRKLFLDLPTQYRSRPQQELSQEASLAVPLGATEPPGVQVVEVQVRDRKHSPWSPAVAIHLGEEEGRLRILGWVRADK